MLLLTSTGCATQTRWQSASTLWQTASLVTYAASIEPPAFGPMHDDGWLLAWADGPSIHTRTLSTGGELSLSQTVYTGHTPWKPTLIPAVNGEWHLLWRDLDTYTTPQLFSALISSTGQLLRGPITIPSDGISTYVAAPGDGGTAVIIWADLDNRPTLYGQQIDAQGRPSAAPPTIITHNAENPAIARAADGTWYTIWLAWPSSALGNPASRMVTVATSTRTLPWQSPEIHNIGQYAQPALTTYVETLSVGLDHTTGYVFLSQRDAASHQAETHVYTFTLDTPASAPTVMPVELPASVPSEPQTVETGFNTGPAWPLPTDAMRSVAWPAPAAGQYQTLPVSFVVDNHIEVGYFEDGNLIGHQPVSEKAFPLAGTLLHVDRNRYLTLSWTASPPEPDQPAPQWLATTHPFVEITQN